MTMIRNAAVLIFLVTLLTGCTGYQTACSSLGDLSPNRNAEFLSSCDLAPGDEVRVHLQDGRELEGSLTEVSHDGIMIQTATDSLSSLRFSPDQILAIDKKSEMAGKSVLGSGILGGLAVAVYVGFSNISMY